MVHVSASGSMAAEKLVSSHKTFPPVFLFDFLYNIFVHISFLVLPHASLSSRLSLFTFIRLILLIFYYCKIYCILSLLHLLLYCISIWLYCAVCDFSPWPIIKVDWFIDLWISHSRFPKLQLNLQPSNRWSDNQSNLFSNYFPRWRTGKNHCVNAWLMELITMNGTKFSN